MTVVINDVSVEVEPAHAPSGPASGAPSGGSNPSMADVAERQLKRIADLQERVRAD